MKQRLTPHVIAPWSTYPQGPGIMLLIGLGLLCVLFGLVAVSAEPLIVALAAAMFFGAALLFRPTWMITLIFVAGLLVVGVVPIWAEGAASKAVWGISAIGLALLGLSLFVATTRPDTTKGTPAFIWVCLAFLIYAVLNSLAQWHSPFEFVGGFKRYFQVFGLIFALAWLSIGEGVISKWRRLFLFIALVQLPFSLYERIVLLPIREGLRYAYPGMVPIDVVAGTLGASRTGGGASGEMALFLIIVAMFLLSRRTERLLPAWKFLMALPLVLAPLFLGEVKAVLVMLPLAIIVFFRSELLRRPHYALLGLVVGAILTVAAGLAYFENMQGRSLDHFIDNTLNYNLENQGYGGFALNRKTALTFWAREQGLHDPISLVLGNGLGASHAVSGGHLSTTRYVGMGIGLTGASTLLWDQGVLGTGLFFLILLATWIAAGRLRKLAPEAWVRADAFAIQTAMPLFAFYLFYRIGVFENMSIQIVFAAMLGYLAWLCRRHSRNEAMRER